MFNRAVKVFSSLAVVMALAACVPAAFAEGLEAKPSQSVEVILSLPESSLRANVFNAFKAKISYDDEIFEPIGQDSFACKSPWRTLSYNPETAELAAASSESVFPGTPIATLKLTVRPNAREGSTSIALDSLVASNGISDVGLQAASIPVNIVPEGNVDGDQPDGEGELPLGSSIPVFVPVPNSTLLGGGMTSVGAPLASTGDDGRARSVGTLAVAAVCMLVLFGHSCLRKMRITSEAAMTSIAVAAVMGLSGLGAASLAFAETGVGYDANRDGKVDAGDVSHVAHVLVGLSQPSASADLNSDGNCTPADLSLIARYVYSAHGHEGDQGGGPGDPDNPSDPGDPSSPDDSTPPDIPKPEESTGFAGYTFEQVSPQDIPVTYTEYQMRTDRMKELGYYGDHSQWPVGLEISRDGALALVGTDCCGLYRSDDQGQLWEQAHTGYNSLNTSLFAIDPNNSSHALALSGARLDDGKKYSGVYETFDGAHTWSQTNMVQPEDPAEEPYHIMVRSWRYTWDGFEFDPGTYDPSQQKTTDVYLSLPYAKDTGRVEDTASRSVKGPVYTYLPPEKAGLYKSTDGGTTFTFLKQGLELCDGILKFTDSGDMYIANHYGLHLVDKETGDIVRTFFENDDVGDGLTEETLGGTVEFEYAPGKTRKVYKAYMGVTGFDVVGDTLYVQTWDGIYRSSVQSPATDDDFEMVTGSSYIKRWPKHLAVSKQNPDHMIMEVKNTLSSYYTNYLYYSLDGGATWAKSDWGQDTIFTQPNDWNSIERFIAFDPTDDTGNTIIANGNGVITRSTDGGATFVQTNGISNIMAGAKFHLNYYNPDQITFGCQDFTGAMSANDGDTWVQMHARKKDSNDPSKFDNTRSMYAAYSPDGETVVGWGINKEKETPTLMVSYEGGTRASTWIDTGIETCITDNPTAFSTIQSYNNPDVIITNEWRSEDRGRTWQRMEGCRSAYTVSYTGAHEMYGGNDEGKPVVSYDDGKTWQVLCDDERFCTFYATVPGTEKIEDVALDHVNNIIYCVVRFSTQYNGGSINSGATRVMKMKIGEPESRRCLDIKFYAGYRNIRSVAVDPNSTSVLYVASVANNCLNPTGLYRSIDGGETFTNLTSSLFYYEDDETHETVRLPNKAMNQGGYEPQALRVDPRTGRCIIGTCCYGYEWVNPPYDESLLSHETPKPHEVRYIVDGCEVGAEHVMNGYWWKGGFVPDGVGDGFDGWYVDEACTIRMEPNTSVLESMTLYGKNA